jgi:hypothetical protein
MSGPWLVMNSLDDLTESLQPGRAAESTQAATKASEKDDAGADD